ncbi:MAG: CRISPR-associated protein Cas4 [Candidatus Methanomethylicaceae archaeon]
MSQGGCHYILDSGKVITGTLVWYFFICRREVWLMSHELTPDEDHSTLEVGRAVHEIFYNRSIKEILMEGIKIDVLKRREKVVCEIKTSSKFIEAARYQLLYYLYRLKEEFGENFSGWIVIPEERKRIKVMLDEHSEVEILKILQEIKNIVGLEAPPPPMKNKFCSKCAYGEFCWV